MRELLCLGADLVVIGLLLVAILWVTKLIWVRLPVFM